MTYKSGKSRSFALFFFLLHSYKEMITIPYRSKMYKLFSHSSVAYLLGKQKPITLVDICFFKNKKRFERMCTVGWVGIRGRTKGMLYSCPLFSQQNQSIEQGRTLIVSHILRDPLT